MQAYDVLVIGGSYAGMAAALQIARARRNVAVIDNGVRRNRFAAHSHGFLTRDGAGPTEIAAIAKTQLCAYPAVTWIDGEGVRAAKEGDGFALEMRDGTRVASRRVVLALGVSDDLPGISGLQERWGRSVFHCPYCHGYELNDGPVGVLAVSAVSIHQAMLIPDWGPTTLFLNGAFTPDESQQQALAQRGVAVEATPVTSVSGGCDIHLADGRVISLAGLFTMPRTRPSGSLAENLGCALEEGPLGPYVRVDPRMETSTSGVFACGDAARPAGSVSLAVGDGALAGSAAHQSLIFQ